MLLLHRVSDTHLVYVVTVSNDAQTVYIIVVNGACPKASGVPYFHALDGNFREHCGMNSMYVPSISRFQPNSQAYS